MQIGILPVEARAYDVLKIYQALLGGGSQITGESHLLETRPFADIDMTGALRGLLLDQALQRHLYSIFFLLLSQPVQERIRRVRGTI